MKPFRDAIKAVDPNAIVAVFVTDQAHAERRNKFMECGRRRPIPTSTGTPSRFITIRRKAPELSPNGWRTKARCWPPGPPR